MVLDVFKFVENLRGKKVVKFIGYLDLNVTSTKGKTFQNSVLKALVDQGFITEDRISNLSYTQDEYIEIDDAATGEPLFNIVGI